MADAADMFRRHHLPVFRYLSRMTGSDEQAEDLTQEVFLRAVRSLPADPELQEKAWLFRTARNLFLNRRRDDSRRPSTMPLDDEIPREASGARRPARHPHDHSAAVELRRALSELDEADRDVFLMRELGGFGYEEIAALSGLTADAVRSRIYRARMALRAALSTTHSRGHLRPFKEVRP